MSLQKVTFLNLILLLSFSSFSQQKEIKYLSGTLTGVKPFPALPAGNISFLDCIPPMGTKLALNISTNTSALGPQSEPTMINGPIKRTLYFYFGLPKTSNSKEQYSRPAVDNVF